MPTATGFTPSPESTGQIVIYCGHFNKVPDNLKKLFMGGLHYRFSVEANGEPLAYVRTC